MQLRIVLLALVLSTSAAIADPPSSPSKPVGNSAPGTSAANGAHTSLPAQVNIEILNATIGPSKVGGAHWDGFGKVKPAISMSLGKALLGASPYGAASEVLSSMGTGLFEKDIKPDPFGYMDLMLDGTVRPEFRHFFYGPNQCMKDTFTPVFQGASFRNVPLKDSTRIRVSLSDKDLTKSEPIGTADINMKDLVAALRAEKVYQVLVADQTQNQLLFVGISVSPVAIPADSPTNDGARE